MGDKIAWLFRKKETDLVAEEEPEQETANDEKGKFTDLFEKINAERGQADISIESDSIENPDETREREKLVLKMTRRPEDGFQPPDLSILDDNPQPDQSVSSAETIQVAQRSSMESTAGRVTPLLSSRTTEDSSISSKN